MTKKATYAAAGVRTYTCKRCGETRTEAIPALAKTPLSKCTVTLSAAAYAYNGKAKTPAVTVKLGAKTLAKNVDYTVSYASGRTKVGTYKVTVTAKSGNVPVSGSVTKTFKVNPARTSIKTLAKGPKSFKVTWTKKTTQVTGYQIRYSTKSSMASAKTTTVASYKTTSKTVKNLKAKQKYYVQVRTYKTVNGTKYYSAWSTKKYVTTR